MSDKLDMSLGTTVTVGLPVYNGATTLVAALESLLSQTYQNLRIVISDNASTDGSEEICRRYLRQDSRITYIRHEKSIGGNTNWIKVLEMCETPVFMWAADDDLYEPIFVEELLPLLESDRSAVLAFCHLDLFDVSQNKKFDVPILKTLAQPDTAFMRMAKYLLIREGGHKPYFLSGIVWTEVLKNAPGLRTYFKAHGWAADTHLVFELLGQGRFVMSENILFHKGIADAPSRPRKLPTPRDILSGCRLYLDQISKTSLSKTAKAVLNGLAFWNCARSLAGNIVGTTLIRWKHVPWAARVRNKLEKTAQKMIY